MAKGTGDSVIGAVRGKRGYLRGKTIPLKLETKGWTTRERKASAGRGRMQMYDGAGGMR